MTIYQMLQESVRRHGLKPAFGTKSADGYRYLTYQDAWARIRDVRRGMAALGVRRGDRIAILSENRVEWALCDLAAQCLGVVTVPIYPTLPAPQVEYLVRDSAARLLFVSDTKQLTKAASFASGVRTLEKVVVMEEVEGAATLTIEGMIARGIETGVDDAELDRQAEAIDDEEIATLIYTSGTTGEPKGAMLTHRALLHTGKAALEFIEIGPGDVFLSFLPLCHVIERVGGQYLPLLTGAAIVYSQGVFALASEYAQVRPTIFLCVPRVYEAMQEKLQDHVAKLPDRQRRIVTWAFAAGRRWSAARRAGRAGLGATLAHAVAERLVLRKVRERVLGDRIRYLVSGGAPLNAGTVEMLEALGVNVLEGYGLTEFPVISINRPGHIMVGSVGEPLAGIEIKLAEDGEILARGPSLMKGYFGKPADTAEVIDATGWFRTGDVGAMVTDRIFKITDRKKDIIVLSNGKNVAPQSIEKLLKESPYISEAVLLGDRQSTVSAIVVPAFDRLRAWAKEHGGNGWATDAEDETNTDDLLRSAAVRKLIRDEIDRLSAPLADFEKIRRFALAPRPFTVDGGELTPTLKVRRRVVVEKYADLIEQLTKAASA